MKNKISDRRPISARKTQLAERVSSRLAAWGVAPNAISIASIAFAFIAGLSLVATSLYSQRIWWILAALFIIFRLLANMFDGMVAVETSKTSTLGELLNEVPDRISDIIIFVSAGYAAGSSLDLGYIAAILAVLIAYIRTMGNYMGIENLFGGPMAKSHRMFTLVALCIFNAFAPSQWQQLSFFSWGMHVIIIGCAITVFLRLQRIRAEIA